MSIHRKIDARFAIRYKHMHHLRSRHVGNCTVDAPLPVGNLTDGNVGHFIETYKDRCLFLELIPHQTSHSISSQVGRVDRQVNFVNSQGLVFFIYKSCNIYIMELIKNVVWVLSGFIATLITMEVGWRLANKQTEKSISSPIMSR